MNTITIQVVNSRNEHSTQEVSPIAIRGVWAVIPFADTPDTQMAFIMHIPSGCQVREPLTVETAIRFLYLLHLRVPPHAFWEEDGEWTIAPQASRIITVCWKEALDPNLVLDTGIQ